MTAPDQRGFGREQGDGTCDPLSDLDTLELSARDTIGIDPYRCTAFGF
jgi:hypothetical protein